MRFDPITLALILLLFSYAKLGDASVQNQEINSNDVSLLNNKGVSLDNLGRHLEAIEYYDRVLAIDPNHVTALYNKGFALNGLGQYDQAIEYFDKVLAMEPNDVGALYNKGFALNGLGQYDQAIQYYVSFRS
jgi:tetratricopeptide (TPR) repeat protein